MKRHLATRESISELQEARKKRDAIRISRAPKNLCLTKEEIREALMSMTTSTYRIPVKIMPKLPF